MAAYAALASLAQVTDLTRNLSKPLFSIGAQHRIRSIHEYVILIKSFLEDFPDRTKTNRWEGKIRDAAREAEDIIEQFMWQKSYYRRIKLSSVKFEDQLRTVTECFRLIAGDMMDVRPASSPEAAVSSSARVAATGNGAVIGLDGDVMAIKDRLCGMSSKLQFISILGMGGIGKTTLARNVYEDSVIMKHFHICAWLTISQDYSPRKVLLGLLDSLKLIDEQMSGMEIDDLTIAEKVYKSLKSRRYLIVMDDVWSTKVLDDVKNVFPNDDNGSRIMLTTRLSDIAVYADSNSPPHEMRFMNEFQSYDLLKQKVFGNRNCPPELQEVGENITRSCKGLPLAVVLVAGFLSAVNKTRSSWEEISNVVIPVAGKELEGILSLSYTHLPHHLRPCFLYIGAFPEDENIRAVKIIRLWLAEGFLKDQNGCSKSLEDEAEEYLEDLAKRNLVMVTSRKSNGKIKRCSLHDMVRDMCIRKAHDEKFLRVIDGANAPQGMITERHISIRRSHIDNIWCPTIRTILCFHPHEFPSSPAFLGRFKLLRVFDSVGDKSKELASQVFELFHLRYLALICISSVPSVISNLKNLQTLIIFPPLYDRQKLWRAGKNVTSDISLPLEIWSMSQLRHLVLYNFYMLPEPPDGMNIPLENLQTLWFVKNLVWNGKILQMIPNVKRLGLLYQTDKEFHLHLLMHLHQLEKLQVDGFRSFSWTGQNPAFPRTLKKLTLLGGRFPWEDMNVIGSLPNLQVLKLRDDACYGETWETAAGEFPQLRYLLIESSCFQHWTTESSHFPRLKSLVLRYCQALREIPKGIGEIPTLEMIEVGYSNDFLVNSAKQINEVQKSYGNYDLHVRVTHFDEISWRHYSL